MRGKSLAVGEDVLPIGQVLEIVSAAAGYRIPKAGEKIEAVLMTSPCEQIVVRAGADYVTITPFEVAKNPGRYGLVKLITDKFELLEWKIARRKEMPQ